MGGEVQGATFNRLFSLLGRRHDDPELLAFLKTLKLKAPRAATPSASTHVVDKKRGFEMSFSEEVHLPGYYPPRRHGEFSGKKNKAVLDLAARAEARKGRTPKVVFEDAAKAYPDFDEFVTALRER